MLQVTDLRSEYRKNPIDLFTPAPRLSWKLVAEHPDVQQATYEVAASYAPDFSRGLWRSGPVSSGQSVLVPWEGPAPVRGERVYWHVRVTDNHGRKSPWSNTAHFEYAGMAPSEWGGAFITGEGKGAGASSAGTLFRRRFSLRGPVLKARLYITAKGVYLPFCNGRRVGHDVLAPGWTEYHTRHLYQTYDVTVLLRPGENTLGAMLGPGWYKGELASWLGRRNIYGARTALLARLEVVYETGSRETFVTDEAWETAPSPVEYSELYHGERYDARLEPPFWCGGGDGAPSGEGWRPAAVESTALSAVCCRDGLPVREQERLPALALFTTPKGERVLDFGQNIAGYVRFTADGAAGQRVVLRHAETLDADGNFYTDNLRSARQTVEYTLKGGGPETYQPHHTFQGFRYACIDEWPGEPALANFEAMTISSAMRPTGAFRCSEPLLDRLVENVRWSMKDNFVDIPTDCPQRDERLGWTGDAQVFARAASYLAETAPFFRKWLRDVAASAMPDGGIPHVVPNVLQTVAETDPLVRQDYGAAGWGDVAVVVPLTMYKYFADRDLLAEQYPTMKNWVEYIRSHAEHGLIWNTGFHFGDWVALDAAEGSYFGATPNDLAATAIYAYSAGLLARAARILGHTADADTYRALRDDIGAAYAKAFFTPDGSLTAQTQTAHILTLVFGLAPEQWRQRTADGLVRLLEENANHLTTGFLGTPFLLHALSENGRLDLAYELLLKRDYPSWLYQVTKGATTVWEHWDGMKPDGAMWSADMNSFNHYAYGAVADWIFSTIGGLDACESAPGFQTFTLAPRPGGGLKWAQMDYGSLYGPISLRWEVFGNRVTIAVAIPPNTRAVLTLPDASTGEYGGVAFAAAHGGAAAELGSGSYRFAYTVGE